MRANSHNMICVGNVPPANNDKWHQRNDVFHLDGISPCETATQGKDPIRVLIIKNSKELL